MKERAGRFKPLSQNVSKSSHLSGEVHSHQNWKGFLEMDVRRGGGEEVPSSVDTP